MTVRTIETFDISDERPSVFLRAWEDFKENGISTPALKLFLLCVKYLLPSKAGSKLLETLMPLRPENMTDRPAIERAIYLHLVHDLPVAVGMAPSKLARQRGPLIMLALTPFRILNAIVLGTGAILNTAIAMFEETKVDAVDIIYTKFVSSMTQVAVTERILPAGYTETEVTEFVRDALYEPSTEVVLEGVVRRLVGAEIFQALLDARASEHSMRMLAMKNATDNATELVDDLTLEMNKARQAAITQELAEISGGAEALK